MKQESHGFSRVECQVYEYVYAYSFDGAAQTFFKYHKKGYGAWILEEIMEINKEEFKGHHHVEYA